MLPHLVLLSRHFWGEDRTFQIRAPVMAADKSEARTIIMINFPQDYRPWPADHQLLVAYFVGRIYGPKEIIG